MSALRAQIVAELQIVRRNGEQLLLTLGIPLLLLVFFSLVDVLPTDTAEPVDFLAPGILALAVMSTAMVSLGISTGFERGYHVLKRLGTTPLGRPRLVIAKIASIAVVEVVQFALLIAASLALGWSAHGTNIGRAIGAVLLGTAGFAGIGLAIAGRLRPELNLAAQNGLYLLLLLLGGMMVPFSKLPAPLRHLAQVLPSGALADALRDSLGGAASQPGTSWLILVGWAVVAPLVAAVTFRWD